MTTPMREIPDRQSVHLTLSDKYSTLDQPAAVHIGGNAYPIPTQCYACHRPFLAGHVVQVSVGGIDPGGAYRHTDCNDPTPAQPWCGCTCVHCAADDHPTSCRCKANPSA